MKHKFIKWFISDYIEIINYIKSLIDPFECNDERLSDAIKRLQVLIDEAK